MLSWILKMAAGPLIDKVMGGVKTVFGDKEKRDDQSASYDAKVLEQYTAESLQVRENRTLFDSFVDSINRLVRPCGFVLTVWIFIWPIYDLESFLSSMKAYELLPEWIAGLIFTVWSLFFGGRFISKDMLKGGLKSKSSRDIKTILEEQKTIREMLGAQSGNYFSAAVHQEPLSSAKDIGMEDYYKDMADTSKPLSLDSIVKWNKLNAKTN